MRSVVLALAIAIQPPVAEIQQWFQAGKYEQVIASESTDPKALYLMGLSYERLERFDDARRVYQRLADRGAQPAPRPRANRTGRPRPSTSRPAPSNVDPWALVGRAALNLASPSGTISARALADADAAIQQAVTAAPDLALAHYQRGVIEGHKRNYAAAADAFVHAASLDPQFAYAYYYGGLSFSRMDRADQMAINFERFLRLAPNAPEAGRVQSLMRGVRGR